MFDSNIELVGRVHFPKFNGIRVMMLPFKMEDIRSLPDYLSHYRTIVAEIINHSPIRQGVAYLTIDEALVKIGETHRRPGLHVDGIGPDGKIAGWGGGGGWGSAGMFLASN